MQQSHLGWPTGLADVTQNVYKCVLKFEKSAKLKWWLGPEVENRCSHQWTRQPSPFRRDSCMNAMLCLKCCVLWSDRQMFFTRLSSCKKFIYSLILVGYAHLRFKRTGVVFQKPTSTHFTLSQLVECETTAACSLVGGFNHELWDFLPALKKKKPLPEILNLTKITSIRSCLWQNCFVFALKSHNQSSTNLTWNTTEMVHNKVTVCECVAFPREENQPTNTRTAASASALH